MVDRWKFRRRGFLAALVPLLLPRRSVGRPVLRNPVKPSPVAPASFDQRITLDDLKKGRAYPGVLWSVVEDGTPTTPRARPLNIELRDVVSA